MTTIAVATVVPIAVLGSILFFIYYYYYKPGSHLTTLRWNRHERNNKPALGSSIDIDLQGIDFGPSVDGMTTTKDAAIMEIELKEVTLEGPLPRRMPRTSKRTQHKDSSSDEEGTSIIAVVTI